MIAIGLFYAYYLHTGLGALPPEISWSFVDQLTHPWRWEKNGNSNSYYYSRTYGRAEWEFRKVNRLLEHFFKNDGLVFNDITAIYNPALTTSFINQWHTTQERFQSSHSQFFHETYSKNTDKCELMHTYHSRIGEFQYKKSPLIKLVPALHGTDYHVAGKIAQTGFASLSSLDAGYYGKGIYFTTHLLYTLPYCLLKRFPAVIISYLNMGNVFPVTESHTGVDSMMGQPLRNGYNSHYIRTNRNGLIHGYNDENSCDGIFLLFLFISLSLASSFH